MPHFNCVNCLRRIKSNDRKRKASNPKLQSLISCYEKATNKQVSRNGLLCENCFLRINFKNPLTVKVAETKYLLLSRNKASIGSTSVSTQVSEEIEDAVC